MPYPGGGRTIRRESDQCKSTWRTMYPPGYGHALAATAGLTQAADLGGRNGVWGGVDR